MISIIVTLFNYARYIESNIQSALAQTNPDWEMVIVDDHSSDDPLSVVRPYMDQYPEKIRFYRLKRNMGYSFAKNHAIVRSKGKFIVNIDADDLLTPRSLEIRQMALEANPSSMWVHGRAFVFKDTPASGPMEEMLYRRWRDIEEGKESRKIAWKAIHAQTVMARADLYKQVGLYDENMRFSADREMWRRFFSQGYWPLFVDTPVCHYRMHGDQMHKSKFKAKNKDTMLKYMDDIISIRKKGINSSNTRMWQDEPTI